MCYALDCQEIWCDRSWLKAKDTGLKGRVKSTYDAMVLDLKKQIQGMRNNLLLTPEAKQKKETELRKKQQSLIGKSRKFEQTFRQEERRLTIEILKEIKPVIRTVAQKEKYDLVLEKIAVREIILYIFEYYIEF